MKVASDDVGQMKVALREVSGSDCVHMKLVGQSPVGLCTLHHKIVTVETSGFVREVISLIFFLP